MMPETSNPTSEPILSGNESAQASTSGSDTSPSTDKNPGGRLSRSLARIDQLYIKQNHHIHAVISGRENHVRFDILDNQGELVLRAEEQAKVSEMRIKSPNRGFTIHVQDLTGNDIIIIKREYRCRGSCPPCRCLQEMVVEAPPGNLAGEIRQSGKFEDATFTISDKHGKAIYKVSRASRKKEPSRWDKPVYFEVKDAESKRYVGEIVKEWSERIRNLYTRSAWVRTMNFNVLFPMNLRAEHKAIILSMSFLLDYMFYQKPPADKRNDCSH